VLVVFCGDGMKRQKATRGGVSHILIAEGLAASPGVCRVRFVWAATAKASV